MISNPFVNVEAILVSSLYNRIKLLTIELLLVKNVIILTINKFLYKFKGCAVRQNKLLSMHINRKIIGLYNALLSLFKKIIIIFISIMDPVFSIKLYIYKYIYKYIDSMHIFVFL